MADMPLPPNAPPAGLLETRDTYNESPYERALRRDAEGAVIQADARSLARHQWRKDGTNLPPTEEMHNSRINLIALVQDEARYTIAERYTALHITRQTLTNMATAMVMFKIRANPVFVTPPVAWTQQLVDEILQRMFDGDEAGDRWHPEQANTINKVAKQPAPKEMVGYLTRDPKNAQKCFDCSQHQPAFAVLEVKGAPGFYSCKSKCASGHFVSASDITGIEDINMSRIRAALLTQWDQDEAVYAIRQNTKTILYHLREFVTRSYRNERQQAQRNYLAPQRIPQNDLATLRAQLEEPKIVIPDLIRDADQFNSAANLIRPAADATGEVHDLRQRLTEAETQLQATRAANAALQIQVNQLNGQGAANDVQANAQQADIINTLRQQVRNLGNVPNA